MGPSQSAFRWVSAALSPEIKQPEPEDIHFRRVLKLRMNGAVPLLLCLRCAVHSDTFTVTTDGSKCVSCGSYLTAVTWAEVMIPEITLTLRRLMSYIYMEHPFLMFLDHTQRRSTVGRTPLDE